MTKWVVVGPDRSEATVGWSERLTEANAGTNLDQPPIMTAGFSFVLITPKYQSWSSRNPAWNDVRCRLIGHGAATAVWLCRAGRTEASCRPAPLQWGTCHHRAMESADPLATPRVAGGSAVLAVVVAGLSVAAVFRKGAFHPGDAAVVGLVSMLVVVASLVRGTDRLALRVLGALAAW